MGCRERPLNVQLQQANDHYAAITMLVEHGLNPCNEFSGTQDVGQWIEAWSGHSERDVMAYLTPSYLRQLIDQSQQKLHGVSRCVVSSDVKTSVHSKVYFGKTPTPFGPALIVWSDQGVRQLHFMDSMNRFEMEAQWRSDHDKAVALAEHIFFTQEPLAVEWRGTPFQTRVWQMLQRIGSAQLLSFAAVARLMDVPQASRAVGTAIGKNSIGYLVPCHRVVRGTGAIGTFRWGATRKAAMLLWEALRSASAGINE